MERIPGEIIQSKGGSVNEYEGKFRKREKHSGKRT